MELLLLNLTQFNQHAVYEGGQWAALFIGEDMNINPTSTRRTVVIDIQTRITDEALHNLKAAAGTEVITSIQLIADDGMQVIEAVFSGAPERDLLRDFWGAVRRGEVFYGYQVVDRLVLLRRRTWASGLLPSRELDLPRVYQHITVDTARLRSSAGDAGYHSAQALASVLGLRTRTSKPRGRSLCDAR
jgi:hypothetical protein